jgi:hypothetical protein
MKKGGLTLMACLCLIGLLQAQNDNGFGFRGGLNYNANGDYLSAAQTNAENSDRNIGYHIGIFGKIGRKWYVKPELVYTKTKSDYTNASLNIQKLDAPLLVGVEFFRFLNVFGGPSLQYILESDYNNISIDNIKSDFTVGLNFGVGVTINKIGIDVRYERGFTENEGTFIENNTNVLPSRIDTRPDQLILSLSLLL